MLPDEPDFIPYSPGNRTVDVVNRIHEGKTPQVLTLKALQSLGVPEGNAARVQKTLRFLGLITPEHQLDDAAVRLRKATSDEYEETLAELIRASYQPIFVSYDPATATDTDLNNAFKPYDPAGQRQNMIGLFMALCREAGLASQSSEVRKRGRPSVASTVRRSRESQKGEAKDTNDTQAAPVTQSVVTQTAKIADGVLFHPAIDALLREGRKVAESDEWTIDARDRIVSGFQTLLDLFLPVKK
jgi:hypothetical protein